MELGSKKKETHPYLDEGGDVARVEDEDERARGQLEADLDAQDQRQGEEQRPPAAVAADATDATDVRSFQVAVAVRHRADADGDGQHRLQQTPARLQKIHLNHARIFLHLYSRQFQTKLLQRA